MVLGLPGLSTSVDFTNESILGPELFAIKTLGGNSPRSESGKSLNDVKLTPTFQHRKLDTKSKLKDKILVVNDPLISPKKDFQIKKLKYN